MSRFDVVPPVRAWLRSRGLILSGGVALLVAATGAVAADVTLRLPFLRRSVPLPVVVILVSALVVATPLQSRFGGLERTLVRSPWDRALACLLACLLAIAACLPASLAAGPRFSWSLLLALLLITVVSTVVLGTLAWLPPVVLGLAAMYLDFNYHRVVSDALDALGTVQLAVALCASLVLYVLRGARIA